jgi:hypothetical protein
MSNQAMELALEAHLEEGISVIRALMAKSDCSVDRNEEFYRAAQWMQLTQDRYIAALKEAIKHVPAIPASHVMAVEWVPGDFHYKATKGEEQ